MVKLAIAWEPLGELVRVTQRDPEYDPPLEEGMNLCEKRGNFLQKTNKTYKVGPRFRNRDKLEATKHSNFTN